jgi:starch synthase
MSLRVAIISPEATPYSKTGGLGDVAGSLARALRDAGAKVSLFLPFYRETRDKGIKARPAGALINVPLGQGREEASVLKAEEKGMGVYFIRKDEFFDRPYAYTTPEGDYEDNLERFSFFSRAVLEAMKALHVRPTVIHLNDWQTGLVPAYLKDAYKGDPFFSGSKTLFTIHNMAYQGLFPGASFGSLGLSSTLFNPDGMEFWGKISLLKSGIVFSDMISTVSRAYSKEIQTEEFGCGLHGLLKVRGKDLYGILNGVDYSEWDPEKDAMIPARYSAKDLGGKAVCKKWLLREFGLKLDPASPLLGMVSRLTEQKGFSILGDAVHGIRDMGFGLAILGSGDKACEEIVKDIARRHPDKVSVRIAFDSRLAHLVEAGSDMFVMPSRFEPCGLNQILSMKYGTIPLVRAVGGLDDTVRDISEGRNATGFKFKEYRADSLSEKLREAVNVYNNDKDRWAMLMNNAMKEVFSWQASVREYMGLYSMLSSKPA